MLDPLGASADWRPCCLVLLRPQKAPQHAEMEKASNRRAKLACLLAHRKHKTGPRQLANALFAECMAMPPRKESLPQIPSATAGVCKSTAGALLAPPVELHHLVALFKRDGLETTLLE